MLKEPKITSLQYLKENVKGEVIFLPGDKRQRFPQVDTIILSICGQACPNYPNNKFAIFLRYLKKLVLKLIFCIQIRMEVSYKLIL